MIKYLPFNIETFCSLQYAKRNVWCNKIFLKHIVLYYNDKGSIHRIKRLNYQTKSKCGEWKVRPYIERERIKQSSEANNLVHFRILCPFEN